MRDPDDIGWNSAAFLVVTDLWTGGRLLLRESNEDPCKVPREKSIE